MPRWRQGLYALLTLAMLLLAAEAVLALVGVRPMAAIEDPYVGFAQRLPLFIEETRDGVAVMSTAPGKLASFNRQSFPRHKPTGAYRIFCLGGSTTYGRPWDDNMSFCGWLRRFLVAADPSREWEVINAGGISYASYRVTALMEELVGYQPDLFVVYTGHNEFLEERTYREVRELPRAVVEATAVLGHTRLFTALRRAVTTARDRIMFRDQVADRLSRSIGPEDYHRDDTGREAIRAHFRFNLVRMVSLARAAGSEISFVMPASNLKDMGPFKSEISLPPALAGDWLRRFDESLAEADPARRLAQLDALASEEPRYAALHYERGRALLALERPEQALQAYLRAEEEDVVPLRMLPSMADDLRATARRFDVPLVDFAALLEERNRAQLGHSILGKEWFPDHVHLTVEGYRLLGLQLLGHLHDRGVLARLPDEATIAAVTGQALALLDPQTNGRALMNLGVVLGWAGKLEEAHRLLLEARELIGADNPTVLLRLGESAERLGRHDEAAAFYGSAGTARANLAEPRRRLAELARKAGDHEAELRHRKEAVRLSPDSPSDVAALAELLAARGDWVESARWFRTLAELAPDDALVRLNLAVALANDGQRDAARAAFDDALRLDPARADAHLGLGSLAEDAGDLGAARLHYGRAVEVAPNSAAAQMSLGAFLANQGDVDGAVPHFRAAAKLDPSSADAEFNLAMALRANGLDEESKQHFEAARRLGGGR